MKILKGGEKYPGKNKSITARFEVACTKLRDV